MYLKEHGLTYFNNRREAADMSQKVYEYESVKNEDGSICYIIGIRKDIRARIGKQPGDRVHVTVAQQQL